MLHLYRYLAALAAVSAACAGYALAVAPWLEPPPIKRAAPVAPRAPVQISTQTRDDLARLFPPDAWERNDAKVKVIETDQATLLLEDYEPTPDGLLKLVPCTIIFYVAMPAADGQSAPRRPIVLQAPHGAELEFDQPLDLARAQLGRLMQGKLRGDVLIFSPPTAADGSDALRLTTREVKLDREKITTTSEVAFQYGQSFGRGRELTITLLHKDDSRSSAKSPSGVQSLTLTRLERLHLEGDQGLVGPPPLVSGQAAAATALEVTCRGEFAVDLVGQIVRFDNQVEVTQLHAGAPPDRLYNCDELVLALDFQAQRPPERKAADSSHAAASHAATQGGTSGSSGRIRRIIARGSPAILDAPGAGARAEAAVIDYLVQDELLCLEPAALAGGNARLGQIVLRQDEQQLVARRVKYQMTAPQRLGLLLAEGPGELRGVQGAAAARQTLVARWEKSLQIRPDGRNRVISLDGAASVSVDPLGRFDANELHLWVVEVPAARPNAAASVPAAGGAPPAGPMPGDAAPGTKAAAKTTILPDRLLAVGKVSFHSPQLDAETARLEAWFVHVPPQAGGPAPAAPALPLGPVREPVAPASFADGNPPPGNSPFGPRDVIRPPNLQKFQVGGELIQLQVRLQGRKTDLEHLTIRGRAVIDELRTPEPGQIPIRVAGDRIELRGGTTPQEAIKIVGQPAEAGGRGLTLRGATIDVLRQENRLSIPGPGEATLPAPRASALAGPGPGPAAAAGLPGAALAPAAGGPPAVPPQPVHVAWLEGLEFDGQTARIRGDVSARSGTQVVTTQSLDATLAQRVDFGGQGSLAQPELARLYLEGGVKLENRSVDERGAALSYDQVVVPNLTLDLLGGTLHASGPGYVRTVRRQAPGSLPGGGLPGAGVRGAAPPAPGAGVPPDVSGRPDLAGAGAASGSALGAPPPGPVSDAPLTSIHIDFRREIAGLLAKRQIEFRDDVRTTYSPAREFTDQIAAAPGQPARELGERVVVMTSQRLTVTEMALAGQPAWVELQASGNVSAEGASFWIKAATIGYSSDKEVLVVAGDGYADAEVHYQAVPGARASYAKARKFMYWLRDGIFRGEDFSVGDGWLGGFLKLPGLGR